MTQFNLKQNLSKENADFLKEEYIQNMYIVNGCTVNSFSIEILMCFCETMFAGFHDIYPTK